MTQSFTGVYGVSLKRCLLKGKLPATENNEEKQGDGGENAFKSVEI